MSLDTNKGSLATVCDNTLLRGMEKSLSLLATRRHLQDGVPTACATCQCQCDVRMWRYQGKLNANGLLNAQDAATPHHNIYGQLQNQANGLWERTGIIVEVLLQYQYTIRVDGSSLF